MLSECLFKIFRLIIWNENDTFFISYWCSAKKSQPSCKIFLQVWQNCSSCVNWNFLRIHGSCKKTLILVFEKPANVSALFRNKNRGGCRKCIQRVFWNILRKIFLGKTYSFINLFRQGAKTFRFLSEMFQLGFRYCILRVDWNRFRENTFREKTRCFCSSAIWWKVNRLLSQLFRMGCQTCFQLVHRNTLKLKKLIETIYMLFLFELCRKKIGFASKRFRQCCQSCILRVHWKTFSTNRLVWSKYFSSILDKQVKFLLLCFEKFATVLSKMQYKCP